MASDSKCRTGGNRPASVVKEAGKASSCAQEDPLLLTKEAARYLRMSHRTLERWRRVEGQGPMFEKMGPGLRAGVRYRLSDLDAWRATRRFHSTAQYNGRAKEPERNQGA
jgi:hypothetical protein